MFHTLDRDAAGLFRGDREPSAAAGRGERDPSAAAAAGRGVTGLERDMTGREILTVNINQITTDLGKISSVMQRMLSLDFIVLTKKTN